MIRRYLLFIIILFSSAIVCISDVDVVQEDNVKIVRTGEDVHLTCTFSKLFQSTTAWFKQTAEGKSLQIVSLCSNQQPRWNEDLKKTNRFNVINGDDHFNLTILKIKPSDSAMYYCVVSTHYNTIGMGAGTTLLVRDAAVDRHTTLQQSLIDMLHPGDSVSLQCSIFTERCAGEHSVYWFRQSSGESQGVLYTKGERNGWCKTSTQSQTQSCVYNLIKSDVSRSDAGIYYCAVAACGEILFGKGTELNFRESGEVNPILLVVGVLNIIFSTVTVCMTLKLCQDPNKKSQGENIWSCAAQSSLMANELKSSEAEVDGHMGNSKHKDHFGRPLIMRYYLIVLLSSTTVCSSDLNVVQEDNVKIVRAEEDVNLTCTFSRLLQSTAAWFKQTAEEKSLLIVSLYLNQQPTWNEDFKKTNRFNVINGDNHFNLTILKIKPSDSATYYCVVASYYTIGMGAGTTLLVKDAAVDRHTTLQQSLIDTLHPGDSVSLQCSIFKESCAEEHSVYWFRQSSGESQGVLYTKGERNGQCENRTESKAQSCVYNLLKSNVSQSDAGIYYCAVAACREILFGKGTELNFRESVDMNPALLALGFLNIIFLALVVFLGIKLCRGQNKVPTPQESQNEDTLNYAAISFAQKPLNTRRAKAKIIQDQSLYAQVRSHQ
ncbi:hypothetical protein QQF64_030808 [Cirrhinus molitorella]|uniref:Ig-like domain-containing protein n=1 Tax=Cirrhinus molitorella TaxID=172907 RepID=A0ABR3N4P1_9TELE